MGTPMGLFHHRASLAWEREETRFRGWWRWHYTTPTWLQSRLIDVAQAPHTQLHGYHHASEAPEPSDWRDTRA